MVGRWDALGVGEEHGAEEDGGSGRREEQGRIWHVQAHARNSVTCMKVDPVNGSGVSGISCISSDPCAVRPSLLLFPSYLSRLISTFSS